MQLFQLLGQLHRVRFTGALTLHFRGGYPRVAEWGPPNRVALSQQALDMPSPAPVDSRGDSTATADTVRGRAV